MKRLQINKQGISHCNKSFWEAGEEEDRMIRKAANKTSYLIKTVKEVFSEEELLELKPERWIGGIMLKPKEEVSREREQ